MSEARFKQLSWTILKHKVLYYRPSDKYKKSLYIEISDAAYDDMEREYLKLCKEFGKKNTLVHKEYAGLDPCGDGMMEIDENRPSVKWMVRYLRGEIDEN